MGDFQRSSLAPERDIEQAITALKKGATLLKYGRRGKPKFCPFRLSTDETKLIWYSGKEEKYLKLAEVSRIIPGQRTAIFQRYPRPEKEYQSFSLICSDRSLDLICKDKDEAEVWLVGLRALTTHGNSINFNWKFETRSSVSSESPRFRTQKTPPSFAPFVYDPGDNHVNQVSVENASQNVVGKAFSDIVSSTAAPKISSQQESVASSLSTLSPEFIDSNGRSSAAEAVRVSLSSAISSSSHGSGRDDFDSFGDVFIWGEGTGEGILGGGEQRSGFSMDSRVDAAVPRALESTVALDVQSIACGYRHAVIIARQGEAFSWGEESGGRLGHGTEADLSQPKVIEFLSGTNVDVVACGEHHTCAVTISGDLYTWGDGTYNSGLLGHGSEASHWIPKKVAGPLEGIQVTNISCGPWHTAAVTSNGQLFTFGEGSFGALGHGDRRSSSIPREVESLRGLRTTKVSCGVWHTAAVVEATYDSSSPDASYSSSPGKLFTWGDGDKGRLGHGDKEARLVPECVSALGDETICQVSCGHVLTIALSTSGKVYTMGSTAYGQLGNPLSNGKLPTRVHGAIGESFIQDVACGSYHIAVLTSKSEIYTWGKGLNGQLGHGDNNNRDTPTLVNSLKDKQPKSIACGSNFTAIICLHKWVSSADHSVCTGCHNPFNFRRKRHNCYNCGLVFCKSCSSKKSLKAALAPNMNKPYRVCDDCYSKLKKAMESSRISKEIGFSTQIKTNEVIDKDFVGPRLQSQVTRLLSTDSPKKSENRAFRQFITPDLQSSRVFPVVNENSQRGIHNSKRSLTSLIGVSKKYSGSKATSRSTSPLSRKSSPRQSLDEPTNDSGHVNKYESHDILSLKAQVEDLTGKCQHLEAELERTKMQLKDVKAIAAAESQKSKAAKEIIKSLTAQLKEMADRMPEEQATSSNSDSIAEHASNAHNLLSDESYNPRAVFSQELNENADPDFTHVHKWQAERSERVVQDEPGVYITVSSLPGGGNELKRVRFSRRHFTEEQAQKWWAENGVKVCERHNITSTT